MDTQEVQKVIIRAMPPHGFKTRMRAGKRWTTDRREVRVVDAPADCLSCKGEKQINRQPCAHCGATGKRIDEITPSQLVEIQNDPHMAVQFADVANLDADALNEAKAKATKLAAELAEAQRDLAGQKELTLQAQARDKDNSEKLGAEVQGLRAELDALRGQIASRRKKD